MAMDELYTSPPSVPALLKHHLSQVSPVRKGSFFLAVPLFSLKNIALLGKTMKGVSDVIHWLFSSLVGGLQSQRQKEQIYNLIRKEQEKG